jgi:1,2-phenylacetyl-CoA epoxidase catalytic subunit
MEQKPNEQAKKWGKLISQCWADETLKQRFIADPAAVLMEAGLEVPEGVAGSGVNFRYR